MGIRTENSGITTLDSSNLSYQFERVRIIMPNIHNSKKIISAMNKLSGKELPPNLTYLEDFHDSKSGTSGTAFKDKDTGEVIIAYTGTNPQGDFSRDVTTDVMDIAVGSGSHYKSVNDALYCFWVNTAKF